MLLQRPDAHRDPTFRSREHLTKELAVQLEPSTEATASDVVERAVPFDDRAIPYDTLILASGSAAPSGRDPPPGRDPRPADLDDCQKVRQGLATAKRVVMIGADFIGAEVVSAAHAQGLPMTVVEAAPIPLVRADGDDEARCAPSGTSATV